MSFLYKLGLYLHWERGKLRPLCLNPIEQLLITDRLSDTLMLATIRYFRSYSNEGGMFSCHSSTVSVYSSCILMLGLCHEFHFVELCEFYITVWTCAADVIKAPYRLALITAREQG